MKSLNWLVVVLIPFLCIVFTKTETGIIIPKIEDVAVGFFFDIEIHTPDAVENLNLVLNQVNGAGSLNTNGSHVKVHNRKAFFKNLNISSMGLYTITAKDLASNTTSVSNTFRVVPEVQCNGALWNQSVSCNSCVSTFKFNCAYCQTLNSCVPSNWKGPLDFDACPDYNLNVCFVKNHYPLIIVGGIVLFLILSFLTCCCCKCYCQKKRNTRRMMENYDRQYLIPERERAKKEYGTKKDRDTAATRRLMEEKYGIASNSYRRED